MCKRCGDEADDHGGLDFKSDWAVKALGEIMKFTRENEYGVIAEAASVMTAATFLSHASAHEVKEPIAGVTDDGGVAFEFLSNSRGLDVEVSPDGEKLEFLLCIATPGRSEGTIGVGSELGAIPASEIQDVRFLIQWLRTGEFFPELTTYLYSEEEIEALCSSSESGSNPENPSN